MIEIKRVNTTFELCPICEWEVEIPADQVSCNECKFNNMEV